MNCNSNTIPLIETETQTACNNGCPPKDINVICRKIAIPTGQNILGVQGDLSSISRIFVVPKITEEGYDLSDKIFHMVIENIENEQWEELISAENIEILENYIKLKWNLLPKDTQYSGVLKVSIKASKDNFTWQTYIASFEIQPSLVQPEDIKIPLNLQDKTVEPNNKVQVITYDDGYDGLNSVTVNGSANLLPENIVTGKEIFNVEGTFSADGNAISADLLEGKIAYSQGQKIEGTLVLGDIEDASYLFYQGARLNQKEQILAMCKNIKNAKYMFANIRISTLNIGNLNTNSVTDMSYMFNSCGYITSLDLSSFDTQNTTTMGYMFYSCSRLENLNLGNKFDTSKVTDMDSMFRGCYLLKTLPAFKADSCKDVNSMFDNTNALSDFGGLENLGKAYVQHSTNYYLYGVNVVRSNNLTHDSLMNIINGLYDLNLSYDVANGGTLYPQNLALGKTNKSKLTEEEIAIATNKGWNVA